MVRLSLADYMAHEARHKTEPRTANRDAFEGRESELQASIVEYCKRCCWIVFHGSTAFRTRRTIGECDLTVLADRGRVFFIEVKTRTGKIRPEQAGMIMAASVLGHKIHVIRSLKEFIEVVS